MLVNVYGAKCVGIESVKVTVEVEVVQGIGIHLVGLADTAVKESLLRTVTALQALGYHIPGRKIVINLAPADLRKNGSGYDLPIAIGILAASGQCAFQAVQDYVIMGELGLDGSIRDVPGALPFADMARTEGFRGCILPLASALEAVDFRDISLFGVSTLADVVRILSAQDDPSDLLVWNSREYQRSRRAKPSAAVDLNTGELLEPGAGAEVDFSDIIGQEGAKRGIEIAAAGGHNLIMMGPPGAGKSSLAKAMAGILPPMTRDESIVTSKIYSIAGLSTRGVGLIKRRPFRAPHYSASIAALVGGGAGDNIIPGEVSLAMNGVLFLDEFGQMPKSAIEALRGPIEDRKVTVSRLKAKIEYPASFMLVAASNPCPCGYWGEGDKCTCTPSQRASYLTRLSGPILDRLDLHVYLRPVSSERILTTTKGEPSSAVAARVLKARIVQKQRFACEEGISTNAQMSNRQVEKYCPLSSECRDMMVKILEKMGLSMRAYFRIIKVARTIADLEGEGDIRVAHLAEAAGFRFLDKQKI